MPHKTAGYLYGLWCGRETKSQTSVHSKRKYQVVIKKKHPRLHQAHIVVGGPKSNGLN